MVRYVFSFTLLLLSAVGSAYAASPLLEEGGWGDTLYSDVKAAQIGDLITVLVIQNAKALQSTETGRSKSTELKGNAAVQDGTGFLKLIPNGGADLKFGGGSSYSGSRSTAKQTNLVANITARVVETLEPDLLRIEGHQSVLINREQVELSVSGVVRRTDINPDNSVLSSALADAQIKYRDLGKERQHGIVTRTITWPFRVIGTVISWLF